MLRILALLCMALAPGCADGDAPPAFDLSVPDLLDAGNPDLIPLFDIDAGRPFDMKPSG